MWKEAKSPPGVWYLTPHLTPTPSSCHTSDFYHRTCSRNILLCCPKTRWFFIRLSTKALGIPPFFRNNWKESLNTKMYNTNTNLIPDSTLYQSNIACCQMPMLNMKQIFQRSTIPLLSSMTGLWMDRYNICHLRIYMYIYIYEYEIYSLGHA